VELSPRPPDGFAVNIPADAAEPGAANAVRVRDRDVADIAVSLARPDQGPPRDTAP
jgi:hypothetical protein